MGEQLVSDWLHAPQRRILFPDRRKHEHLPCGAPVGVKVEANVAQTCCMWAFLGFNLYH